MGPHKRSVYRENKFFLVIWYSGAAPTTISIQLTNTNILMDSMVKIEIPKSSNWKCILVTNRPNNIEFKLLFCSTVSSASKWFLFSSFLSPKKIQKKNYSFFFLGFSGIYSNFLFFYSSFSYCYQYLIPTGFYSIYLMVFLHSFFRLWTGIELK